jgi:hypothetical protein
MRTSFPTYLHPALHGFGARRRAMFGRSLRSFRHWLHRATDQAIGLQLTDARFNPFLYSSPRC